MNNPIAWHQNCLRSGKEYLARKREEVERLVAEIKITAAELNFYEAQVEEAIRRGKTSFDRDKFTNVKSINRN